MLQDYELKQNNNLRKNKKQCRGWKEQLKQLGNLTNRKGYGRRKAAKLRFVTGLDTPVGLSILSLCPVGTTKAVRAVVVPQVVLESHSRSGNRQISVLTISLQISSVELVLSCAVLSGVCCPALHSIPKKEVIHFLFLFWVLGVPLEFPEWRNKVCVGCTLSHGQVIPGRHLLFSEQLGKDC